MVISFTFLCAVQSIATKNIHSLPLWNDSIFATINYAVLNLFPYLCVRSLLTLFIMKNHFRKS